MSPYFTSFMRVEQQMEQVDYRSTAWVNSFILIGHASAMPFSGLLEHKLGVRMTVALGCAVFCVSVCLSAVTVQWNFAAFVLTYGFLFGTGIGIAYPLCLACSIRWFPANKGTITGVTLLTYGLSSFVFNILQSKLINPDNLAPEMLESSDNTDEL